MGRRVLKMVVVLVAATVLVAIYQIPAVAGALHITIPHESGCGGG
jgi:hypothetical protein